MRHIVYSLFAIASLLILTDFLLPGIQFVKSEFEVKKELQQYFNAAGNSHFSYKVITDNHDFTISEGFAQEILDGQQTIQYRVSQIFQEVNGYGLADSKSTSMHSLRIFSGLILPLFVIITLFISFRKARSLNTLVFVLQVLLIADLLFLIM
ncbi:hypothetical protein [Mongoliibacter ruber]|uniref:Uncharacterized protein n=1 Tax=Mongoliibacter ruber TaxID=1750599 RepID=A0A2T0WCA1_9BACT|nr:hypothetical protein [Mongoliibacter ruber]PRY84323.1 hypothetical protein CLW00_12212 [Mongoliibacter ruber]